MATVGTSAGWGGRGVLLRAASFFSGAPAMMNPATGKLFFYSVHATGNPLLVDIYGNTLMSVTLSSQLYTNQSYILIGYYLYIFYPTSSTNINVKRIDVRTWTDNGVLQSLTVPGNNYYMYDNAIAYDGSNVLYSFSIALINSAATAFSYNISGNSFSIVKNFTIITGDTLTAGAGLNGSTLYFCTSGGRFYSLDTGGVTLTLVRSSCSMSGYHGFHIAGTTLYNAGESLSWALNETPSSVVFLLDDVAATPKLIYTSSSYYHEASGATDLIKTAIAHGWVLGGSGSNASSGIFPFNPVSVDYTAPLVATSYSYSLAIEAQSRSREVI
jgi:hypothetical protein